MSKRKALWKRKEEYDLFLNPSLIFFHQKGEKFVNSKELLFNLYGLTETLKIYNIFFFSLLFNNISQQEANEKKSVTQVEKRK